MGRNRASQNKKGLPTWALVLIIVLGIVFLLVVVLVIGLAALGYMFSYSESLYYNSDGQQILKPGNYLDSFNSLIESYGEKNFVYSSTEPLSFYVINRTISGTVIPKEIRNNPLAYTFPGCYAENSVNINITCNVSKNYITILFNPTNRTAQYNSSFGF